MSHLYREFADRPALIYKPTYLRHVVRRFENAAEAWAFRGMIPVGTGDEEADEAYVAIEVEYTSAKAALMRVMDKMNGAQAAGIAPGSCSVMPKDENGSPRHLSHPPRSINPKEKKMLKNTLARAREEIIALRASNAILEGQMRVLNVFAAALEYQPRGGGMGVDVAWELQKEIEALAPDSKEPIHDE